ncbi:MAG: hypothetical protein ISR99_02480 [Parcubacteria group bacterium]|nr:hypothetical protein [Parcubacteria group bacterium]
MESERDFLPKLEKPDSLYHGTNDGGIESFEPRKRYTPNGFDVPPRVYATANPAFAAAHSFPWMSSEGVDLSIDDGNVLLSVPEHIKHRLDQEVFIYKLSSDSFENTSEEATGETFHSEEKVQPQEVIKFGSVTEAVEHFGGKVEII